MILTNLYSCNAVGLMLIFAKAGGKVPQPLLSPHGTHLPRTCYVIASGAHRIFVRGGA